MTNMGYNIADNAFGLTDRKLSFVVEYIIDFNAARAARVLNIEINTVKKWMREDPNIHKAVSAYLEKRRLENEELVKKTLEELLSVMTSDIRDFVKWTDGNKINLLASKELKNSKAVKGIEKTKTGVKLILHDKVKAIDLMMQGLGMMKRPIDPDKKTDREDGQLQESLFEALHRAHEERRVLPQMKGMIEIDAGKDEEKKGGNG